MIEMQDESENRVSINNSYLSHGEAGTAQEGRGRGRIEGKVKHKLKKFGAI